MHDKNLYLTIASVSCNPLLNVVCDGSVATELQPTDRFRYVRCVKRPFRLLQGGQCATLVSNLACCVHR